MTVSFSRVPNNLRAPLFYVEFDNSMANSATATQRSLIIGQMLTGAAAQNAISMKMNYYRDKNTDSVFAYDDEQLSKVARLSELEVTIQEKEPLFVEAGNNLQLAMQELNEAKVQLDTAITNSVTDDEDKANECIIEIEKKTQIFDAKNEKFKELLTVFELIESEYQPLKDEYDVILPVFFDIREHLNILKKMTDKEINAYFNPPTSKEQLIAEAEVKKQLLADEAEKIITILERKVRLGIATDDEKDLLTEWEIYSIKVADIDTSLVPVIDWPKNHSLN
ncbi:tail fiber assembly protein [Providencia rettgeri]|nr:tail fiber assembly protein [Providencia rettgeri]MBO8258426.1 tail fiber assembly protein [Providencia rettgeri]